MHRIADTGLIVALINRKDPYHAWAVAQAMEHAPFATCEGVLIEAGAVLGTATPVLRLVQAGDLCLAFNLAEEVAAVQALCAKYQDRAMDMTDACLVRMSEIFEDCRLWTIDRQDFSVYRRYGRRIIPCFFPDPIP